MSFEYLDHTADVGLRARGATAAEAFCEAAAGMFGVMVRTSRVRPEVTVEVAVSADSLELLLVGWLSELLARKDVTGDVFSQFGVRIESMGSGWRLKGTAKGETLDPRRHEPGTGEIHYNRVLKEAYELGYRGYVGLECRPTEELAAARAVAAADVW